MMTPRPAKIVPTTVGVLVGVEGGIAVQSNDSYHFGRYTGQQDSGAQPKPGWVLQLSRQAERRLRRGQRREPWPRLAQSER